MEETRYKRYLLVVLMFVLAFNGADRFALGLVLQDIKIDLELSDTQLGVLSGIAFALFFSLMGLPIARWADRGNRVTIIAVTTVLWSVAVALCGTAGSFLQLLLIRIGAAVGQAGCMPPAHSLIADHFTRAERPRAVARYMLGTAIGVLLGYFLAGWLNELYGWRTMFVIVGLPGVALGVLVWFTLVEPRRGGSISAATQAAAVSFPVAQHKEPAQSQPTLREVFATLWGNATFRHLVISWSVISFFTDGIFTWLPAYFVRSYGLSTGELGSWFAVIWAGAGLLGTYWGGEMAARWAGGDERLQLRAVALIYAGFGALSAAMYFSRNMHLTFALLGVGVLGLCAICGPLFATIQTLVPERMRAMSIALVYLFANLIGTGLGPLVVGALSDALRPHFGEDSLRYSLLVFSPGFLLATWTLWLASRTVDHDVKAAVGERGREGLEEDPAPDADQGFHAVRARAVHSE